MADRKPIKPDHAVGNIVEVVTAYGDGQPHSRGRVVGYCAEPTFLVERPDGTRFSWVARMTFEAPPPCANRIPSGDVCELDRGHAEHHSNRASDGSENFWVNRESHG